MIGCKKNRAPRNAIASALKNVPDVCLITVRKRSVQLHKRALNVNYSNTLEVDLSSNFFKISAGSANFARKIIAAMMYGL